MKIRQKPSGETPTAESVLAVNMLGYRTLAALVGKGVLKPHEAAAAATKAANDLRLATEGEANQADGEASARQLEVVAGWLLKCTKDEH